jgi:ribosomal protein L28
LRKTTEVIATSKNSTKTPAIFPANFHTHTIIVSNKNTIIKIKTLIAKNFKPCGV